MDVYVQTHMSSNSFWKSVNILITKFNVINKRLWSSKILYQCICKSICSEWTAPLRSIDKVTSELIEHIEKYAERIIIDFELSNGEHSDYDSHIQIIILELLPKKYTDVKAYQLICLDKMKTSVTFYNITPESPLLRNGSNLCPDFTYSLSLESETLALRIGPDSNSKQLKWLEEIVLPQFVKWGRDEVEHNKPLCKESLQLVSTDEYYKKYNELKQKYGKEMVENWPEGTDPYKFVYEDVAIATYLLLLWENDTVNTPKKTFVDLGCGNGLLVYILTNEGHNGIGIDVRKRKIWDFYPKNVNLEEKTIIPSDSNVFPQADWLIGNHSDELTPWIPVIASNSSYNCSFFLLPCCAFNFDGTKYQRKDSSKSQYMEYIEYVKSICEYCGFETSIDRLKIPSTKRICLVGQKKTYSKENHPEVCAQIQNLINKDSSYTCDTENSWVLGFQPRNAVERVRNCTQIDSTVINNIVNCIAKYLLEPCDSETEWSLGKDAYIHELITLLSKENLKAMKAECGGLQTLLRNNHHIFKVHNGKVQIRYPRTVDEVYKQNTKAAKRKTKVQVKPCWFYKNHPKGCPLTDITCSYLHIRD